jgi:hypothetical protein
MSVLRDALTLPPRPPERAGHLGPVLMLMLAREPYQRPVAQAAEQLLRRVAEGGPALATAAPAKRGNRLPLLVGTVVVAAAIAAVAFVALRPGTPPSQQSGTPVAARAGTTSTSTPGPSPTPTPTPTPTPPPTPSVETAKFTSAVNMCSLLTRTQIAELVPGAVKGKRDGDGCDWAVHGVGLSAVVTADDNVADRWSATPEDAQDHYINARNIQGQLDDIIWNWPAIGLDKTVKQPTKNVKDLKGLANEAFTYELVNPKSHPEKIVVVFRLSNVVVEVGYVNVNEIGKDAALRKDARDAARWLAEALNRQE